MYRFVLAAEDEVRQLMARAAPEYVKAVQAMMKADLSGDPTEQRISRSKLELVIGQTMTYADLLGRKRLLMEADSVRRHNKAHPIVNSVIGKIQPGLNVNAWIWYEQSVLADSPLVPQIPFEEAIVDLARREPRLAQELPTGEPLYERVQDIYQRFHAVAAARAADISVTKRLQEFLAEAVRSGTTVPAAKTIMAALFDWTSAYSETVFRTNVQTGYSAGRFRQAFDPDVAEVIPAFEYDAVLDHDVRKNHAAAHGLIARTTDPIWHRFSPPMGYNCRCGLSFLSVFELRRRGLVDASGKVRTVKPAGFDLDAHPDKGFGKNRPDIALYGGSLF